MSENGTQLQEITIQNWAAKVPVPFGEGHILTENQANALNQIYAENVRNNFAKKVKDAREKAAKDGGQVDFVGLQAELNTYAASYEFGTRKGGGGGETGLPKDPILRQAHVMARDMIRQQAKKKSWKLSAEQVAGLVPQLLEKNPAILEEAKRQVEAQASIIVEDIDLPEPVQEAAPVEAEPETGSTSGEDQADPNAPSGEPSEQTRSRKRKG